MHIFRPSAMDGRILREKGFFPMAKQYDAGQLTVLEGLEAVRMRPGMYIGTTSTRGLHHLLWEIVDNAIDEASNGHASEVRVTLHTDEIGRAHV